VPGPRKEILLLDHAEIGGGGQLFALHLAVELRGRGHPVRVGCEADTTLASWCRDAGIEVIEASFPPPTPLHPFAMAAAVRRLRRLMREVPPDSIVIANHTRVHAYLFAARRRRGGPAIVNVAHEQVSASRPFAGFLYRRSGALLVVGANAARIYEEKLPGAAVTKVNNFLSADYFTTARATPDRPSRYEGRIGVLARLIPVKGVLELVDELADEAARGAWKELRLGGPAQDRAYVKALEDRISFHDLEDRIRLAGEIEDVPAFLDDLDALVMPSTGSEAQGRVIIEALAHGLPVIVRDHIYSADFEGLPVIPYSGAGELGEALGQLPTAPADVEELIDRFGPEQAIDGLEAAVQLARARS
jgi:glycosyltransferase involved in cell wall biosynthesis